MDQKCFVMSVLAHLHPQTNNPQRVLHYIRHEAELNMKGISYPVQIGQISKFETQNDVSINVIGFEDGDFSPIYISKCRDKAHEIDLLCLKRKGRRLSHPSKDVRFSMRIWWPFN